MNNAAIPSHSVRSLNLIASAEQELSRALGFGVPRPLLNWITGLDETEDLWTKAQSLLGPSIFDRLLAALGTQYHCPDRDLERIPQNGPALLVSNHPFGLLDGLLLGSLVHRRRSDYRILANSLLASVPEIGAYVIAVSVIARDTRLNGPGLRAALRWMQSGGALVIFPAGEVSAPHGLPPAISDPQWNHRVLQLAIAAKAPVVPVHVSGRNSAAFQCAGFIHPMLRTALLSRELMNKRGRMIEVGVGHPIPSERFDGSGTDRLAEYVRERTYLLGERRVHVQRLHFRRPPSPHPVAPAIPSATLAEEISGLPDSTLLMRRSGYSVYLADAREIPQVLDELGRLREITFRAVGEGTGRPRDLDSFDRDYQHLFIWNEREREVVGAYRIGRVDRILQRSGAAGLYTHQLFQLTPEFLKRVGNGLELGRSFVRQEYQRSIYPLYYLWKGICVFIGRNPSYRYLFGPVSISNDYTRAARELMVRYFRGRKARGEQSVQARRPFHTRPFGAHLMAELAARAQDVEELSTLVADLEPDGKGIPVLLRHYLGLGAEVLEFNVDPAFAHTLDALIVVDLTRSNNATLEKYMGREALSDYLAHQGLTPAPAR
jgi:putative hemolysin